MECLAPDVVFQHVPVLDMTGVVLKTLHFHLKKCLDEIERVLDVDRLALMFEIEDICIQISKEVAHVERCGHD